MIPAAIARGYAAAGAAAISVLTEPTFFDGALEHLEAVRAAVDTPLLRKDFIVSEYQLLEARAAGADAALLIVARADAGGAEQLAALRETLGLDTLVEVHDADELAVAIDAGARDHRRQQPEPAHAGGGRARLGDAGRADAEGRRRRQRERAARRRADCRGLGAGLPARS